MVFKFAIRKLKNQKKYTLLVTFPILLCCIIVSFFALYNSNQEHFSKKMNYQRYGKWQYASPSNINSAGHMYLLYQDDLITFGSIDKEMIYLGQFHLLEGRMPKNSNEVVLQQNLLDTLKIEYKINQEILLNNGETYNICGIISNYTVNWKPLDNWSYFNVFTVNKTSDICMCFVDTGKSIRMTDGSYYNDYSYPELVSDNSVVVEPLDVKDYLNAGLFICCALIICCVFLSTSFKRKKQLYIMNVIGIKKDFFIKEVLAEGLIVGCVSIGIGAALSYISSYLYFSYIANEYLHSGFDFQWRVCIIILMNFILLIIVLISSLIPSVLVVWIFNGKRVIKKRRNNINLSIPLMIGFTVIIGVLIGINNFDLNDNYWQYQGRLYEQNAGSDYLYASYSQTATETVDSRFGFGNEESLSKDDIMNIQNIYGIESVEYSKSGCFDYSYGKDNGVAGWGKWDDSAGSEVFIKSVSYSYEDFKSLGIELNKSEYQAFQEGKYGFVVMEGFYIVSDEIGFASRYVNIDKFKEDDLVYLHDGITKHELILKDIYRVYSKNNRIQTLLTDTNLHSTHCAIIVSEKYIEDTFGYNEDNYQIVSVNANSNANYEVTDKQLSSYGFKNYRMDLNNNLKHAREELLTTTIILCLLIVIIIVFSFISTKLYMYRYQRRIGLLKVMGIHNKQIIKTYLGKINCWIMFSLAFSMLINHIIRAYYYYEGILLSDRIIGTVTENKYKIFIECLLRNNHELYEYILMISLGACLLISIYLPIRMLLKKSPIENIKE